MPPQLTTQPVFQKAKKQTVDVGTTLSDLMNSALRHFLAERSLREEAPFVMPVFGRVGKGHQTPAELAKLLDEGR